MGSGLVNWDVVGPKLNDVIFSFFVVGFNERWVLFCFFYPEELYHQVKYLSFLSFQVYSRAFYYFLWFLFDFGLLFDFWLLLLWLKLFLFFNFWLFFLWFSVILWLNFRFFFQGFNFFLFFSFSFLNNFWLNSSFSYCFSNLFAFLFRDFFFRRFISKEVFIQSFDWRLNFFCNIFLIKFLYFDQIMIMIV